MYSSIPQFLEVNVYGDLVLAGVSRNLPNGSSGLCVWLSKQTVLRVQSSTSCSLPLLFPCPHHHAHLIQVCEPVSVEEGGSLREIRQNS